jgi:hypothetical protein
MFAGVRHLALRDRPCGLPALAKWRSENNSSHGTVQNARVPIPFLRADNASISVALGSRRRARAPGPPEVHRTLPGLSSSRRRPGGLSSSAARRAMSATGRENLREHLLEQDVEECAT